MGVDSSRNLEVLMKDYRGPLADGHHPGRDEFYLHFVDIVRSTGNGME